MTQTNEPVRLKLYALIVFIFAAVMSVIVASPQVAIAQESTKVEGTATFTAGKSESLTLKVNSDSKSFKSQLGDSDFEFTTGQSGLSISGVSGGGSTQATITFSGKPEKAGKYTITVKPEAFEGNVTVSGEVTFTIIAGDPSKLVINGSSQPKTPSQSGGTLGEVKVEIQDDEGNVCTGETTTISAAAEGEKNNWILGGTTGKDAVSGIATFNDLTATNETSAKVNDASIKFTGIGSGVISSTFNIPAPLTPTTTPEFEQNTVIAQTNNLSANLTVSNANAYTNQNVTVTVYSGSNYGQANQNVTGSYENGRLTLNFNPAISTQQTYQVTFQAGDDYAPSEHSATITVKPYLTTPSPEAPSPETPGPDNPGTTDPDPGTPDNPNSGNVGWGDGSGDSSSEDVGTPNKLIDAIQDAEPGTDITVTLPASGEDLTFEADSPAPTNVTVSGIILGFPESASQGAVKTVYNPETKVFTLTATPDDGYKFVSWTYDGETVSADNPWMAEMKEPEPAPETLALSASSSQPSEVDAGGYVATFAPVETEPTAPIPVYRLYNPYDYLHLYTSDENEIATLKDNGWTVDFEGEPCWYAPAAGSSEASYEIVRLRNPYNGDHYFVKASDTEQIDYLCGLGWEKDSTASSIWSAADTETNVEVYTLFNHYNTVDTHLYTANQTEVDTLVKPDGWELNTSIIWGVQAPETPSTPEA